MFTCKSCGWHTLPDDTRCPNSECPTKPTPKTTPRESLGSLVADVLNMNPAERAEHRRLLRKASRSGALGR